MTLLLCLNQDMACTPDSPTVPVPINLAQFEQASTPEDPIVLLDGVPPPDQLPQREAFFKNLGRFEIICFSHVLIMGSPVEIVTGRAVPVPNQPPAEPLISKNALNLILESEGLDQPGAWPGGSSGITLGIGYDLGTVTKNQFMQDWAPILEDNVVQRLIPAIGVMGSAAKAMAPQFRDIKVTSGAATTVFTNRTLPLFRSLTLKTYPGADQLPPDAEGALISLVYNRGGSLKGSRRAEMQAIHDIIQGAVASGAIQTGLNRVLNAVADEFVAMKRLWVGQGLDGLLQRRDAEAALVRNA